MGHASTIFYMLQYCSITENKMCIKSLRTNNSYTQLWTDGMELPLQSICLLRTCTIYFFAKYILNKKLHFQMYVTNSHLLCRKKWQFKAGPIISVVHADSDFKCLVGWQVDYLHWLYLGQGHCHHNPRLGLQFNLLYLDYILLPTTLQWKMYRRFVLFLVSLI